MEAVSRYGLMGAAALAALLGLVMQNGPEGASLVAWLAAALLACAEVIRRSPRHGILATSALAFGSNAYLFSRKLEGASGPSLCNVNDVLNCDVVNTSAASELFGLPVTLYGMAFFLGLGFATLYHPRSTPRLYQITALLSGVGVLFSAYLAVEASRLGAFCALCATIYVACGLLVWAALRGLKVEGSKLFDGIADAFGSTSGLTIMGTFLVVVMVGAGSWQQRTDLPSATSNGGAPGANPLVGLYSVPKGEVVLDGNEPILGDPSAPYLVVEWADYGCPHCARAARDFEQIVREYPAVQVRFKAFPLSGACNPAIPQDSGPDRCRAALATRCAQQQGKFWEMNHLVFKNIGYMAEGDLAHMARQVGLDTEAWAQCMVDPTMMEKVRADALAGARAGVHGTPAIFVKGLYGDGFVEVQRGPEAVVRLIEAREAGVSMPPPGPPHSHDM